MLNNKNILITGGTGSFGRAFIKIIISRFKKIRKLVILSRDELKQSELKAIYPEKKYPFIRFFLGDIRDYQRLLRALDGIDIVVHAAALKQVPAAENDPFEFIKTNIIGSQNLIEACFERGIKNVVALSTDKAAAPINLYGATKLCADKLFSSANNIKGNRNIKFSVVRYGNVFGSRGSVIPIFLEANFKKELFKVTDIKMSRFNISLKDAVEAVLWTIQNSFGGEIIIPKISSYKILDLIKAINNKAKIIITGIRPGEKIYEEMITEHDSETTYDLGKYYAIINPSNPNLIEKYKKYKKFPVGKSYNSRDNKSFLKTTELKSLIQQYINNKEFNS
jgi:UDP-N-acetylglucosamine 4,6-dehydratase (inverting)